MFPKSFFPVVLLLVMAAQAQSTKRSVSVSPQAVDFGSVVTGSTSSRTIQVTNTGKFSVKVSTITSSAGSFIVSAPTLPQYLNSGASMSFSVSFAPAADGAASGSVTVSSNAQNSPSIITVTGMGATPAAPLAYGNVGDPYEGGTPPAAALISTCQTLAANASYRLTRDLNALTSTDVCLQLTGPNTTIDLNGYKVTGRITAPSMNISGTHIFNGTVECARDAALGANVGCVWLNGDNYPAMSQVRVHHLLVMNTAACGRSIHVGWMAPSAFAGTYLVRMYHITSAAASGPACNRSYNLSTTGTDHLTAEVHNNDLTCPADAGACQGIMFYGTDHNRAHHNRLQLMQNTTAETARGILCDVSDYCEVDNNLIVANNNRAFRVRDGQHARIHDNTVQQITCCGIAAVHLGDPDNPSTMSNDLDAIIENNTFEVRDGVVVMIRAAYNAWLRNNAFTCAGCSGGSNLARVRTGLSTSLILENNPSAAALPSPQIFVETGTAATVCASGQATGSGSVTYSTSCTN